MPGDGGAESPPPAAASAARQRRSTAGMSTLPGSIFLTFITILALAHDKAPDRLFDYEWPALCSSLNT